MFKIIMIFFLLISKALFASTPVWTFTPLTETNIVMAEGGQANVQYRVTNQSSRTHVLSMTPMSGVNQVTSGAGFCSNPFTLATKGSSCILSLDIYANQIHQSIYSGPIVCQNGSKFECYQPSKQNVLTINLTHRPSTTLSINTNNLIIAVNNGTSSLTVTNTGQYNAYNIRAILPISWSNVVQDSSRCLLLEPSNSCILNFSSSAPYVAVGNIPVSSESMPSPPMVAIAFTISNYLVWDVSGTTAQVFADNAELPGAVWSDPSNVAVPGITNTSTYPTDVCNGATDGACNTKYIIDYSFVYPFSAATCYQITSDNTGSVPEGTWYLPAICQLGAVNQGCNNCLSGTANIYTNLIQLGFLTLSGTYWSSTESSDNSADDAWKIIFNSGQATQSTSSKSAGYAAVCARSIT